MTNSQYTRLLSMRASYAFDGTTYLAEDILRQATVLQQDADATILRGVDPSSQMATLLWAANTPAPILQAAADIKEDVLLSFVPPGWVEAFRAAGFEEYGVLYEYWISDLSAVALPALPPPLFGALEQAAAISTLTHRCAGQSREFCGESADWVAAWLQGSEANLQEMDATNSAILCAMNGDDIVGMHAVALYGHSHEKGPVVWVRLLAVDPSHQRQGIGGLLLRQGLQYGKDHGARRAFLMTDEQNLSAHALYEHAGFHMTDDRQIDMVLRQSAK